MQKPPSWVPEKGTKKEKPAFLKTGNPNKINWWVV